MRPTASTDGRLDAALRRYRLPLLVAILLVAAAFRLIGLNNGTPPGLEHDEVAHWLINRDILAGNHAIYFTEAYGHEALYHYLQAGFGALVGDHALALRLPSAYLGIVLVALGYALGRRLLGWRAGLFSAAFLAVLFWPVFYSRLALRAISLPVFSGLSAYFWWRSVPAGDPGGVVRHPWRWFALAGFLAGLSVHTYMAARAVPIFYGLFVLYLLIVHRDWVRRQGRGLALFWLVFALVALPLAWFLWTNPGAEVRIAEVDAPLRALRNGDLQPVLENGWRIGGMFGFQGDPLWRQNIAYRPVFGPILAMLFYLGVAASLWRWRDSRYAFLILWLVASAIPSLVTIDAPSSIRIINLLPVLMLFPALVIHMGAKLSTVRDKFSTDLVTGTVLVMAMLLLGFEGWSTAKGLWQTWPVNEEVRFVWQAALTEAAAYLDAATDNRPVAVGGWTPETMDAPTMELTLRREDLSLRYFNPAESLILPFGATGEPARLVRPAILPFASALERLVGTGKLLPENGAPGEQFTLYDSVDGRNFQPQFPESTDFSGELRLLGYDVVTPCSASGPCTLMTYWQVLDRPDGPRRIFLHRVDEAGNVIEQDDRLGAPAEFWQPGDIVIQLLTLPPGEGSLRLGVYDPADGRRLGTESADFVTLEGLAGP